MPISTRSHPASSIAKTYSTVFSIVGSPAVKNPMKAFPLLKAFAIFISLLSLIKFPHNHSYNSTPLYRAIAATSLSPRPDTVIIIISSLFISGATLIA